MGRKFRTEFVCEEFELEEGIASEFLNACRILDSEGMAPENAGNVSVRTHGGMLIKAGGKKLGSIGKDDVVLVDGYDERANTARVKGRSEPSSETPMHWLIYRDFPGINAVVHAHDSLVLENPELVEKLGIKTTEREFPYGTPKLAGEVVRNLKESRYVFIKNHGSVSVGKSLKNALDLMLQIHRKFEYESKG